MLRIPRSKWDSLRAGMAVEVTINCRPESATVRDGVLFWDGFRRRIIDQFADGDFVAITAVDPDEVGPFTVFRPG